MRTVAIVAGGDSSEFDISVKSAVEVSGLLSGKYMAYIIMIRGTNWYWEDRKGLYHNIDKNDFTLKTDDGKIRFDAVFVAIHGTPGENGLLQGYFDMMQIPYSSCSAFCSALTFNKQACKLYLKEYGIPMAKNIIGENFRCRRKEGSGPGEGIEGRLQRLWLAMGSLEFAYDHGNVIIATGGFG